MRLGETQIWIYSAGILHIQVCHPPHCLVNLYLFPIALPLLLVLHYCQISLLRDGCMSPSRSHGRRRQRRAAGQLGRQSVLASSIPSLEEFISAIHAPSEFVQPFTASNCFLAALAEVFTFAPICHLTFSVQRGEVPGQVLRVANSLFDTILVFLNLPKSLRSG